MKTSMRERRGGEKVNEDNKKEWIRSGPMFLCALECERQVVVVVVWRWGEQSVCEATRDGERGRKLRSMTQAVEWGDNLASETEVKETRPLPRKNETLHTVVILMMILSMGRGNPDPAHRTSHHHFSRTSSWREPPANSNGASPLPPPPGTIPPTQPHTAHIAHLCESSRAITCIEPTDERV